MNKFVNYYALLGLEDNVSQAQIKAAYRKMAKLYHPDVIRHNPSFEGLMTTINEAYETLSDITKRSEYDSIFKNRVKLNLEYDVFENSLYREFFISKVLMVVNSKMRACINKYNKELNVLSHDIYDSELLNRLESLTRNIEIKFAGLSNLMTSNKNPQSLMASILMMRQAIAQCGDACDEINYFFNNYDYNHLIMAQNLFKIAQNLSKESIRLINQN